MKRVQTLFEKYSGTDEYQIHPLPSSGGDRKYFRITWKKGSCIAAIGNETKENETFFYMAGHFRKLGLPVPEILAVSEDRSAYLQEDLGDRTLFDAVSQGRSCGSYSDSEKCLLKQAISILPAFQYAGASGMDFTKCWPVQTFDRTSIMFDLNYFKYCFLKPSGLTFSEMELEEDFCRLCGRLLLSCSNTFMYRDFQSRNIMIGRDGGLGFIDFQGGRMGPAQYDLASFVWQAKARYSPEMKAELTEAYMEARSHHIHDDRTAFMTELRHFILFRTLQVLGAYGLRGLFERKSHFMESIPYAMDNLKELLATPFHEYPYLDHILGQLIPMYGHRQPHDDNCLHIRILSFSYKNGIPEDCSGNGGGYVFDCRGVPNPGRHPEYRDLTGMDKPVIDFLENREETGRFAAHTAGLAGLHIDNYLTRGFSDLMFCFGCTGGRHRSVYFAEKLTEYIRDRYIGSNIHLKVIHREQNTERKVL